MTSEPGLYRGRHYTTYVDEARSLIREKKYDEAEDLLKNLIKAVKREAKTEPGYGVPSAYHKMLAGVYRKRGEYEQQIEILEDLAILNPGDSVYLESARDEYEEELRSQLPPSCPDCESLLPDGFPKKGPCPECGVALQAKQRRKRTVYFSEASLAAENAQKARRKLERRVYPLGLSRADLKEAEDKLSTQWGGRAVSDGDLYWNAVNDIAIQHAKNGDFYLADRCFRDMAEFRYEESQDLEAALVLVRTAIEMSVEQLKQNSRGLPIKVAGKCNAEECSACQEEPLTGLVLEELVEHPVLPHRACSRPICACSYGEDWSEIEFVGDKIDQIANENTQKGPKKAGFFKKLFN